MGYIVNIMRKRGIKKHMKKVLVNKFGDTITLWVSIGYSVIFIILLLLYANISTSFEFFGYCPYIDENNMSDYLSVLSIQFTTVFLTTGLMSTLGSKEDLVYHIDIVEKILLEPKGRTFKSLSIYSFITLFFATIAFVFKAAYLVILTTTTGIVLITYLFFKMIGIYFDREKQKVKIREDLKNEKIKIDDYRKELLKINLVIQKNISERDITPLVDNLALLCELEQHYMLDLTDDQIFYMDAVDISKNKYMYVKIIKSKVWKDVKEIKEISVFEICDRLRVLFDKEINNINKRDKKRLEALEKCRLEIYELMIDFIIVENDNRHLKIWEEKYIYNIDTAIELLRNKYIKDVDKLDKKKDYIQSDALMPYSKFMELSEKIFKIRMAEEDTKYQRLSELHLYGFYEDIDALIKRDEERIRNKEVGGFEINELFMEHMYSMALENENKNACFVRALPRLTLMYIEQKVNEILYNFYITYKARVFKNNGYEALEYYLSFDEYSDEDIEYLEMILPDQYLYPKENCDELYENIMCLFFQGCSEMIMCGKGKAIIAKVVELVFDFWRTAQFYKKPDELLVFYKKTWNSFGCRLLYADKSLGNERYNEHCEDVQEFICQLVYKCKDESLVIPDRIYKFNAEVVFEDFMVDLEKLSPEFYDEDTFNNFREIISGKMEKNNVTVS